MPKIKFEFNHQDKSLYIYKPLSPRQLISKTFLTNWGSPGFILDPANHWITFTIYSTKIRAFYKCIEELENWPSDLEWENKSVSANTLAPVSQIITYYLKDLELDLEYNSKIKDFSPKNALYLNKSSITFTFTSQDEVQKINGSWVKKKDHNSH